MYIKMTSTWTPISGWNPAFSEKEKIECTQYYFSFLKKYPARIASSLATMKIYKQKYNVTYSEDQEQMIIRMAKA